MVNKVCYLNMCLLERVAESSYLASDAVDDEAFSKARTSLCIVKPARVTADPGQTGSRAEPGLTGIGHLLTINTSTRLFSDRPAAFSLEATGFFSP